MVHDVRLSVLWHASKIKCWVCNVNIWKDFTVFVFQPFKT
jgi:hypothetical protein